MPRPLLLFFLLAILTNAHAAPMIDLGIDTLRESGYAKLQGKRVGLLTHPAGVDKYGRPTWKVLADAPEVNLVALYGPEHGIDGHAAANEYVAHTTHGPTGLPAYSLYDKHRKPSPEMLNSIDIMVIDLQDLGVRSYTYVSAMKKAMEACFEQDVEVMVLDRPNPLGGLKVDGPPLDPQWKSYVGEFLVPYVHGMTIGELAIMAKKQPGVLDVSDETRRKGKLLVVPMGGWKRSMLWPDTGLKWVPTSPAIPDLSAAMGYSMTGLGTYVGDWRHGVGTQYNFRLLTYPGRSPAFIKRALEAERIPGLGYELTDGKTTRGASVPGVYLTVTNWQALDPCAISAYMMRLACQWSPSNPFANIGEKRRGFLIHMGDPAWLDELSTRGANARVELFLQEWSRQAKAFQQRSQAYWLY
ncbi:DUF1343 domain-containing protein [Cerasicoccus arenae]|uniref:DUF1343 domain-containing protein n=1 Tax=Cerasicoccus arenae TaxID=424488 RepID=A0A8J3DFK1_9BACT|nr:DUF1343 domain-containing protein [Cerasicoccus arenae]MBK1857517.1 DUF1343 domain-containing protein [Cerasicoccus arenae]GHB95467.1 hypothetical protein GCM10007047_09060 [Cerasicoccus arenae]